jgi:hypothetical protein
LIQGTTGKGKTDDGERKSAASLRAEEISRVGVISTWLLRVKRGAYLHVLILVLHLDHAAALLAHDDSTSALFFVFHWGLLSAPFAALDTVCVYGGA